MKLDVVFIDVCRLRKLAAGLLAGLACSAGSAAFAATDLYISEYVEGSSNNKAVEFFNGTAAPIDLAAGGYKLQLYFNGGAASGLTVNLAGVVPAGGTFVLAHGSASAAILAKAQQTNSSSWFNGDDAVVLVKGAAIIDSIGQIGVDPGTEWGTGLASTADNTLRRKSSVTGGDTNPYDAFYPALEWDAVATDDFSDLGAYAGSTSTTDLAPFVASAVPANAAIDVAVNANVSVNFSEPVNVSGAWYALNCSSSGVKTAQVGVGVASFTLDPLNDFVPGETCTLSIDAARVTDLDGSPSAMAANYSATFHVAAAATGCDAPFTPAYTIQGSGNASTLSGVVTTQGVVVGDFQGPSPALRGFFIQDMVGDNDPATSDAVFVFNGDNTSVQLGQIVRVTGTVGEFQNQTQLSASNVLQCGTGTVAPVDLMLPMASAADFERYEGMLVRLPQTLYVTEQFQLGRFGQVVLSADARQPQPTNVVLPGAPALALQAQNDLARIILDDAANSQNPDPIVFGGNGQALSATNTLRGGDSATGIVGVMTYTWSGNAASGNDWRVRPVNALGASMPVFQAANPRPDTVPNVGGTLRVVGMNVLNYFNNFSGCSGGVGGSAMDCRGADNATEFARQKAKTIAAMVKMDADVYGLSELQNNGYGSTSAIRNLLDALNAATVPGSYELLDVDARTGQSNAMGTDAIKVGFLYRPAKVAPVGTTGALNSVAFQNGGDGAPRNRPALAQAFQQVGGAGDGERFIAVVNHFKSKGSACDAPDAGDGQANCNGVRVNAANTLRSWLATNPTGTSDPDVLVIGDLNSYAKEDPIMAFTANGWVNLIEAHSGADAYSYVFDGQWGYLDHALATPSLAAQVAAVGDWHVNADEPSVLDYNTDFKSAAQISSLYAADHFRYSDHDPVIVGLNLVPVGTCTHPDLSPVVMLGDTNSGVVNRVIDKGCTIDDLIFDEQAWSSQSAFLSHVSKVSFDLLKLKKITAAERSRLMVAAQASGVGVAAPN
ncbi:MAG: ExeM/NucH family extracellular endonuclease [Rhodoferax sp.]|nr:ExeM/NucH family extracellular endonuclease [Rhodoferax sp.]